MGYHPDETLQQAAQQAEIRINSTSFPFDTSTHFDAHNEELVYQSGRNNEPHKFRLNWERPVDHSYILYQTERDGDIKSMELDRDTAEKLRSDRIELDALLSEHEGVPTFTLNFAGPYITSSAAGAIEHLLKV